MYYPKEIAKIVNKKTNKVVRYKPRKDTLSGRILASVLFPENFYYKKKTYDDEEVVGIQDNYVEIKNGILVSGDLIKKVTGAKSNSIVHMIAVEYGEFEASEFISNCQFLCNRWFPIYSFSFGIGDCLNFKQNDIQKTLTAMYKKCDEITHSNKTPFEKEMALSDALNSAVSVGQVLTKEGMLGGVDNGMVVCTYSGAKGNYVNCSQISAYVGQQNVQGGRIPMKISNRTRCLPHFKPNDNGPQARGFIDRSFIKGLTPTQYFFHAQSGRVGLMDTAVNTQESGYIQRRFVKKMENFKIHTDGTVRDCDGSIVSFAYGDAGFDAKHLYGSDKEPFYIDVKRICAGLNCVYEARNKDISPNYPEKIKLKNKHIDIILMQIKPLGNQVDSDVVKNMTDNIHNRLRKEIETLEFYPDATILREFMETVTQKFALARVEPGDMVGIIAACSMGEMATQQTLNSFHNTGIITKSVTMGVPRMKELLDTTKNPKTPSMLIYINNEYVREREDYIHDLILENANASIGPISMSANMENIYQAKKEILEELQSLRSKFEYTTLRDLVKGKMKMLYVPENDGSIPENTPSSSKLYRFKEYIEPWWVDVFKKFNEDEEYTEAEKWVCEINIDVEKLYYYDLSLYDVSKALEKEDGFSNFQCVYSPDNMGKILVFFNYDNVSDKLKTCLEKEDFQDRMIITEDNWHYFYVRDIMSENLLNSKICGIEGVEKIFPLELDDPDCDMKIKRKKWVLDVQGENYQTILNMDIVDHTKTECDNMYSVLDVFGIMACRTFLVEEFKKVMGSDGAYINPSHFFLLSDAITKNGEIQSVRRNGINRSVGPITKACFEEAFNNFVHAAMFTEVDEMTSVSSSIAAGKECEIGTNSGYTQLFTR